MSNRLAQLQQKLITARMEEARLRTLLPIVEEQVRTLTAELHEAENATAILEGSASLSLTQGLNAMERKIVKLSE